MFFKFLSELTLLIHFIFILFVVFGSLTILINKKILFFHPPALFWGIYIEFSQKICPLTYLENWLLDKSNFNTYDESFIERYIHKIVYPTNLNTELQIILGIILIVINLVFYSIIFYKFKTK